MFTSCKKGENDPFLSMRSRNARLSGEWTIKEGSIVTTNDGNTSTSTLTETELTNSDGTNTVVYTLGQYTITFEKEGTYTSTTSITLKSVDGVAVTGATAETSTEGGNWAWMSGNKDQDRKNKEAIIMDITTSTYTDASGSSTNTATGFDDGDVWYIDQLKNKELIVTQDYTRTPDGGTTTTSTGSLTFTQE